jgi:hypothetical protein
VIVTVDPCGDRASDLDVVERRHLDVHRLAEDLRAPVDVAERAPAWIGLEAEQVRRDEVADDVEFAAQELEALAVLVFVERPAHTVEVRKAGPEVGVVADEGEAVPALPTVRKQLERPGAACQPRVGVARARGLAHRAKAQHRENVEERRVRLLEMERDDVLALDLHARKALGLLRVQLRVADDRRGVGGVRIRRGAVERSLDGSLDVVGGDLFAVVKADALAEEEAVRLALVVDDPTLGDVRLDLPVFVVVDEASEDVLEDLGSEAVGEVCRIDRAHVSERGELEDAATSRLRADRRAGRRNRRWELLRARRQREREPGRDRDRGGDSAWLSSCADRAHREALRRGG